MPDVLGQTLETVSLDAVCPHPENPRDGDVDRIQESITANGFYGALVVQKRTGHILVGNHRYLAARQAGLQQLPVLLVDIDDDQARRILLADNRTSDTAGWDETALVSMLKDLAVTPEGLTGTGYTSGDLDALIRVNEPDFQPTDGAEQPRLDQRNPTTCPQCGFEWRVGPNGTVEPV